MRSHVTLKLKEKRVKLLLFQYRKRYEVTCDLGLFSLILLKRQCFNTASGMRSHVTSQGQDQRPAAHEVSIPQAV